jgi:hypothetical protein
MSATGLNRKSRHLLHPAAFLTLLPADQPLPGHCRRPVFAPHETEGPPMNFLFTAFLLVLGGSLLAIGFDSTESIHDEMSRVVIARYNERTIWYILSGSLCAMLGLIGIFSSRRT